MISTHVEHLELIMLTLLLYKTNIRPNSGELGLEYIGAPATTSSYLIQERKRLTEGTVSTKCQKHLPISIKISSSQREAKELSKLKKKQGTSEELKMRSYPLIQ